MNSSELESRSHLVSLQGAKLFQDLASSCRSTEVVISLPRIFSYTTNTASREEWIFLKNDASHIGC